MHVLLLALAVAAVGGPAAAAEGSQRHPLILVSCDGFRYDYLHWYPNETQFLRSLIPRGVHVVRMQPAFATKTFPNHWTLATGLYQESHGIISNSMYDPVFNESFNKGTRDERWWNASLPIWITAKKQGLKTATFFWPGSEVKFQGLHQDYYYEYDGSVPFETRVTQVLDWIAKDGVQMSTLYLNEPDTSGHKHGPESGKVREALAKVDSTIRSLFEGLEQRGLENKVNVLIVSDHGMSAVEDSKTVNFKGALEKYSKVITDNGALMGIFAKPGQKEALAQYIQDRIKGENLPLRVFTKDTMPKEFHYAKNRRTPEVLVLPDQGYIVIADDKYKKSDRGTHGFDNTYSNMQVPLFAVGPSFRKNVNLTGGFRQIDVYGLACTVLKIRPQPNNGSDQYLPLMLNEAAFNRVGLANWLNHFGLLFLYKAAKKLGIV